MPPQRCGDVIALGAPIAPPLRHLWQKCTEPCIGELTERIRLRAVGFMKLSISGRHRARSAVRQRLLRHLARTSGSATRRAATYGVARVAIVHVGEIADALGDLYPALRGTKLEALCDAYFSQGWYKDDFADGAGIDLLYVESIEIDAAHQHKNLDLAMVRRLCDTLGSGCQLAVDAVPRRARRGSLGPPRLRADHAGRTTGLMHMKLGYRHAQVVDATGSGDFEVLPTVVLHDRHTHN